MDLRGRRSRVSVWLVSLTLASGGCAVTPDLSVRSATDERRLAAQLMQEREKELAALRAEMATTRIAAAKQEAELQELRATVRQLRQETVESHQALLKANQTLATRETEVAAMKAERHQHTEATDQQTRTASQLTTLKDMVAALSFELAELKSAMALAMHKPADSAERHDDGEHIIPAVQIYREEASQRKPVWITVQPGESWWSLARKHHTTMHALQAINERAGDQLTVGETIRLPSCCDPRQR